MSKLALEIELGNDAAQTGYDVGGILQETAHRLMTEFRHTELETLAGRIPVRDVNGNTVGRLQIVDD